MVVCYTYISLFFGDFGDGVYLADISMLFSSFPYVDGGIK